MNYKYYQKKEGVVWIHYSKKEDKYFISWITHDGGLIKDRILSSKKMSNKDIHEWLSQQYEKPKKPYVIKWLFL